MLTFTYTYMVPETEEIVEITYSHHMMDIWLKTSTKHFKTSPSGYAHLDKKHEGKRVMLNAKSKFYLIGNERKFRQLVPLDN